MNPIDILIIAITAYSLVMGIFRGIVRELSSLVGAIVGFFLANAFYTGISKYMSEWISDKDYLNILSFLVLFSIVFIVFNLAGVIIKYLLKKTELNWIDRILGAVLGFLKGALVVSVLLLVLTTFLMPGAPVLKGSGFTPHVLGISKHIAKITSKEMKKRFSENMEKLK